MRRARRPAGRTRGCGHDLRPRRRRRRDGRRAARHPAVHQLPGHQAVRPVHPPGRSDRALHEARDADHGRRRHHRGHADRLRGRGPGHREPAERVRAARAVPHDRPGRRGLPGRLHQDLPAAQPRAVGAVEDRRPGLRRHHVRGAGAAVPRRHAAHARVDQHLVHPGHRPGPGVRRGHDRRDPVRDLGELPHHRVVERREPHGRPGRPGHRLVADRVRRVRHRLRVAVQPALRARGEPQVLRHPRPAGHGRGRRGRHGRVLRLPVVERQPRQDLHGRHRLARPRRRARRHVDRHPHRGARRDHRRPVRHHRAVGRHPDRLLQDDRQAGVQDGAAAPPLRAVGVGRGHDRDPVLADRRVVRVAGHRDLLRGVGDGLTVVADLSGAEGLGRARVVVAGLGVSGRAARDVLAGLGARVTTVDDRAEDADVRDVAAFLAGDGLAAADVVVASPGWPPAHPLLAAARAAGVPVWSEVELAWRLRVDRDSGDGPAPWLAVTGTNGKTTTVEMLASVLRAAGRRTAAVGNVGTPVVLAATDPALDVLAVELSSFQLHFTHTMSAQAAAVLNVAPDHLDWHGDLEAYAAAKGRIYERAQVACIYNVTDPRTQDLVEQADVVDGAVAVGFTTGTPLVGQVGMVEDVLVDRGFARLRHTHAAELATLADLAQLAGPDGTVPKHVVADALAAAALALAHGVEPVAVRDGLRSFGPSAHRIETVAVHDGVAWVDDSKATNAHAAAASLAAFDPGSVVWVAGGLAKGAQFDELVAARRDRLRAVVLIGVDRAPLREALARHAPEVPVVEVDAGETGSVMTRAVLEAGRLAATAPSDEAVTVLLAPACASMDQFASYAARGEEFAAAVRALGGDA